MSNELFTFLRRNAIVDIQDFIAKSNFKIDGLQTNISNSEISCSEFGELEEKTIPLSQILGFSESNLKIDKSFFSNFSNFFDSRSSEQYHNRSISMLDYSINDIMQKLSTSFDEEPINTISIDGKYYISSNGLHRFMTLKLYYALELYQGKTREDLDKKYMIKVNNKELDVFGLFARYFGENFVPSIEYRKDVTEKQWLEEVKERLAKIDDTNYQSLISRFCFTRFINNDSGELTIKYLFEYFPNIATDIFKYLIMTNNYEHTVNIINCVKKYYPSYENELIQFITSNLNMKLQNYDSNVNLSDSWEYFDLENKCNEYGTAKDISNKSRDSEHFSEGSENLRKTLIILWNQGIETEACCKGNHLSLDVDNNPTVNCEAYISFTQNQDWKAYLSSEIISSSDVIIEKDAIYYYGNDSESFFKVLCKDFLTGKKNNNSLLAAKDNNVIEELKYKSFIKALQQIGFDEEQIAYLSEDYLTIEKCMKEYYQHDITDRENAVKKWNEAREHYNSNLDFYINRNNQKHNSQIK